MYWLKLTEVELIVTRDRQFEGFKNIQDAINEK
jgi:hypothetical protein